MIILKNLENETFIKWKVIIESVALIRGEGGVANSNLHPPEMPKTKI
jgi:hypothetical protein